MFVLNLLGFGNTNNCSLCLLISMRCKNAQIDINIFFCRGAGGCMIDPWDLKFSPFCNLIMTKKQDGNSWFHFSFDSNHKHLGISISIVITSKQMFCIHVYVSSLFKHFPLIIEQCKMKRYKGQENFCLQTDKNEPLVIVFRGPGLSTCLSFFS